MTVQDLYNQTIKHMPAPDRLTLAKLILEGIPRESVADYAEDWSEEDLKDFSAAGWRRANETPTGERNA